MVEVINMKKLVSILMILCVLTTAAVAHSGRTDSSGGHRDNKNASGLGGYHYHHGYSAHLHPGGVCPYDAPAPASQADTPAYTPPAPKAQPSKSSQPTTENKKTDKQKAEFLDEYIAIIVSGDDEYYHRLDCKLYDEAESFKAYNVSNAEQLGYEPCEKCH